MDPALPRRFSALTHLGVALIVLSMQTICLAPGVQAQAPEREKFQYRCLAAGLKTSVLSFMRRLRGDATKAERDDAIRARAAEQERLIDHAAELAATGGHVNLSWFKSAIHVKYGPDGRVVLVDGKEPAKAIPPPAANNDGGTVAANMNGGIVFLDRWPSDWPIKRPSRWPANWLGRTVLKLAGVRQLHFSEQDLADYLYPFYVKGKMFELIGGPKIYRLGWAFDPQNHRVPFFEMERLFPDETPLFVRDVFGKNQGTAAEKALLVQRGPDGRAPIEHMAEVIVRAYELGIDPGELEFAYSSQGKAGVRIADPLAPRYIPNRTPEEREAAVEKFEYSAGSVADMLEWFNLPRDADGNPNPARSVAQQLFERSFRIALAQVEERALSAPQKAAIIATIFGKK